MSNILIKVTGDGLPKLNRALDELGRETNTHRAYRIAVNRVGAKAWTATRRTLAKQVGLTQTNLKKYGRIQVSKANYANLAFTVTASGAPVPLKAFGAKQFGFGVRAKPWGKSQRFPSAFIFAGSPNSGKFVGGGHVFRRTSNESLPLKMMYGPSIPKEMVQDASAESWQSFAPDLQREAERALEKITEGVIR